MEMESSDEECNVSYYSPGRFVRLLGGDKRNDEKENRFKNSRDPLARMAAKLPLDKFDGTVAFGQQKLEWIKYRDQFLSILKAKGAEEGNPERILNIFKIHGGCDLVDVYGLYCNKCDGKKHFSAAFRSKSASKKDEKRRETVKKESKQINKVGLGSDRVYSEDENNQIIK